MDPEVNAPPKHQKDPSPTPPPAPTPARRRRVMLVAEAPVPPEDLTDAAAYKRVEPDARALTEDEFSALNLDLTAATATILRVAPGLLLFRDAVAALPGFNVRAFDALVDRAKAARYASARSVEAEDEPVDLERMLPEYTTLRTKLTAWAVPLGHSGKFDQARLAKIQRGWGRKAVPSDLVELVALYRRKWDEVKTICGVTETDLARAEIVGPALFAAIHGRDDRVRAARTASMQLVRRFWTLADRSYSECQRAITYLRWHAGDAAILAPSLRCNSGRPAKRAAAK